MAIEFELKFRATPQILAEIAQKVPGEQTHFAMETTYYDTPDDALSAKFFTLRRRLENRLSVCTLKTPAGQGRNEFEVTAPSIEDALPKLCKLSGQPLPTNVAPICGAKFNRTAITVCLPDAVLELALDEGILTGGGKQVPLCEVEVELKEGTPQAATRYAVALAATFGLVPEQRSKFRRSQMLRSE